jgi:PKD repeat protein
MVWCVILAIGLAGYKMTGNKPCVNVIVAINGTTQGLNKTFFIGETVRFSALFSEGKKVEWDFGDNSNVESGMRSTHTYKTEGRFPVTITIDGNCIQHDMVTIKKFIADTTVTNNDALKSLFGNPIDGNYSPTVGQAVVYSSTVDARSYEWSISNYSNYQIKNTKEAQYVFLTPGLKVLQLVLDGDPTKTYKKDIIVQPLSFASSGSQQAAPPPQIPVYIPSAPLSEKEKTQTEPEKPADKPIDKPVTDTKPEVKTDAPVITKPVTIRIGNENFKDMLQDVVNNNLDVADFNDYLCDQGKTRVLINDEKNWTNFADLCNKIRGDKRVTITGVEQTLENNCVVKIKVKFDRKNKFLGL